MDIEACPEPPAENWATGVGVFPAAGEKESVNKRMGRIKPKVRLIMANIANIAQLQPKG
jgi:hypothetical protein